MAQVRRALVIAFALQSLDRPASALSTGISNEAKANILSPVRGKRAGRQQRAVINVSAGWEYVPRAPRLAIVTGGTPDVFESENYGAKTLSLMLEYARKHEYGLYVDRNFGHLSSRKRGWNKIRLLQELLHEVPVLAWVDADIVLRNLELPLLQLMETRRCNAVDQEKWEPFLPPTANKDTFLWVSADMTPIRYLVNVNTGVMILRNTSRAHQFLESVWKVGDEEQSFAHHNDPWALVSGGDSSPEYGWPWEQGAVWDVLATQPDKYMRGSCVTEVGVLQSVRSYNWGDGQLAQHCAAMSDHARTKAANYALMRLTEPVADAPSNKPDLPL